MRNVNELALKVKEEGVNTSTPAYSKLTELLIPVAQKFVNSYKSEYRIDKDELFSLLIYEGVQKAFKIWYDPSFPFLSVYKKALQFITSKYIETQMKPKNLIYSQSVSLFVENSDGEEEYLEKIDPNVNIEEQILENEFFAKLATLSEDEKKVAYVLMNYSGKQKGEAFARIFGKESYDATLRNKVERIKKKLAKLLTNG